MKTILILNSPEFNRNKFEKLILEKHFLVAVDGGINHIESCPKDIEIDLHIGDMDSCHKSHHKVKERITFPVEKDFSDYYLALEEVSSMGFKEVFVFAGTGGRTDHFLAVYESSVSFAAKGLKLNLIGTKEELYFRNENFNMNFAIGTTVSIYSGQEKLTNLSLQGFKYLVTNYEMERKNPIGLSNLTTHETVSVNFNSGVAVMITNKQLHH